MWLSFIEEIIINEVLKTHEGYDGRYDDFEGYTEDKLSVSLVVQSPYDRLYTAYLKMKIDEENGETTRYNNSAALYNTYMMEYRKYYNKTHMPLDVTKPRKANAPAGANVGLSDAEYENLKKDMTYILTEYFSASLSADKINDVIKSFVSTNIEMLKGKDGRDGVDGKDGYTPRKNVDYFDGEDGKFGKEGNGVGAEIFNDYENNIADGDFSRASGIRTRAGSKCFKFDDTVYVGNQKYNHEDKYYIKDVTDEIFSKLQEIVAYKPFYTVVLNYNYDLRGKLVGVGTDELGTYIQVTNYLEINADVGTTLYDGSYVHFPDYAELGTENMGTGANADGYETQALAVATHSEGAGTRAIGKYAHVEGRDTIATYAGHGEGRETAALEENTHAEGDRGAVTGFGGHIEGVSSKRAFNHIFDEQGALKSIEALIETYKSNPFSLARQKATHVEGGNNLGLGMYQHIEGLGNIGIADYLHMQGKYAEIDYERKYLDIVGYGTDDNNRKNVRTLDREGNGWYAKDVYIKGKTFKDTSLTLNKEVPLGGYSYKLNFDPDSIMNAPTASVPSDCVGNQYTEDGILIDSVKGGAQGNLALESLKDGTYRISLTGGNSGRFKFLNFLTSESRFTSSDIGRKFIVSIRYKHEKGWVRAGLMSKATGDPYQSQFYSAQEVVELTKSEWTVANLKITIDERMVEKQIGLIAIDFYSEGSIIVDYIESVELKRFEDVICGYATSGILQSPNGTKFQITVNDDGTLATTKLI